MPNNKLQKLEDVGFFITMLLMSVLIPLSVIAIIGKIILSIEK